MKTTKLVALIALFIFIAVAVTFLFYFLFVIDSIKTFPMFIEISDGHYGMNGDTDVLNFGKLFLFAGGAASGARKMQVANFKTHSTFVTVAFSGQMASWIQVNETNFILEPGEKRDLKFIAKPPVDTPQGNYTGKAKIVMKRFWD